MRIAVAMMPLVLSGCALLPDTISPSIEHLSHTFQHAPLTISPTKYAVTIAEVSARWGGQSGPFLEVSEGIALNDRWVFGIQSGYGEIFGPREQFAARLGYTFQLKNR
jgi:hypothetical protein